MLSENTHPTDQELLLAADGELSARSAMAVRTHLSACWHCRARMSDLEGVVVDFVRVHRQTLDAELPPIDRSRAQLSAQLSELDAKHQVRSMRAFFHFLGTRHATAYISLGLLAASLFLYLLIGQSLRSFVLDRTPVAVTATVEDGVEPDPRLTPGATRLVSLHDVCAMPHEEVVVDVPTALRERILQEYGIAQKHESDYEIDFLVAPLLGGTEDPQNLWPESYSSPVWNARVKDDLEERLHELVCSGKVNLTTAQNDISTGWISAYKKYFNSDLPIRLRAQVGGYGFDSHSSKQGRVPKMRLFALMFQTKVGV